MLDKINLINVALTGNAINPAATITNVMAKSLEWLNEYSDPGEVVLSHYSKGAFIEYWASSSFDAELISICVSEQIAEICEIKNMSRQINKNFFIKN